MTPKPIGGEAVSNEGQETMSDEIQKTYSHPVVAENGWAYVLMVKAMGVQFPQGVFLDRRVAEKWANERLASDVGWWLDYAVMSTVTLTEDDHD